MLPIQGTGEGGFGLAEPAVIVEEQDKGLKKDLGFFSTLIIGLNSTAPAD